MGKEDHETWTSTVILGSPAETFRARRTHVMFLGRFMVVVTGTGWQVGQCIIRPFGLVRGHDFPWPFNVLPRTLTFRALSLLSLISPIKGSWFPLFTLSIMRPLTQTVRHLPLCLLNGILRLINSTLSLSPLFSRLLLVVVLAGWSCQNDHYHGRPSGK